MEIFHAMHAANTRIRAVEAYLNFTLPGAAKGHVFEKSLLDSLTHLGQWRAGDPNTEPDVVHKVNTCYSFEVKTCSPTGEWLSIGVSGERKAYCPRHLLVRSGRIALLGAIPEESWKSTTRGRMRLTLTAARKLDLINLWDYTDGS